MVLTNVRNCVVHMSLACLVSILSGISSYVSAQTGPQAEVIEHAKRATVGILEDTQDPRTPDKPGKIKIRGTGFHLHDGYIVTARHAVEKTSPAGHIVPKIIHVLTTDLHELVAQIVGESAYLDVVVYRLNQKDRPVLEIATRFAAEAPAVGSEVFTVGYPMGWGPTMAFGRIGNDNTFLQTVETRLLQADLSACSGNSGGALYNQAGEVVGICDPRYAGRTHRRRSHRRETAGLLKAWHSHDGGQRRDKVAHGREGRRRAGQGSRHTETRHPLGH